MNSWPRLTASIPVRVFPRAINPAWRDAGRQTLPAGAILANRLGRPAWPMPAWSFDISANNLIFH